MPRKLTVIEKAQRFKRNKLVVNRIVRGHLAKKKIGIVHGTRATNSQLPRDLQRKTVDWDVFVKNPRMRAEQLEKKLDKRFGGDLFRVEKGTGSPGIKVYKIKSNVNDEGFVDFATSNREVASTPRRGVRMATLADQRRIAAQNIKKMDTEFRREKDLDLLKRISTYSKRRANKIR